MKKQNVKKKLKLVSLFSGCGGKDLGFIGGFNFMGKKFEENPYDLLWANDFNEKACLTYKNNFGNHIVCGDIWKVDFNSLPKADVVTGGFPCQDFSLAGLRKGFNSNRGLLYLAMKKVIDTLKPKAFIAENVKGLLSTDGGKAIQKIKEDFTNSGYKVEHHLVNAANYGISQTRERVFIIGFRNDLKVKFKFPEPTHSEKDHLYLKRWVPVKDVIGDLEDVKEGEKANHFWSKAKLFPGTQGNSVINPDKPGPTMRAEHHGNIEFHYNGRRRLSAREAARIQTFPDNFVFYQSTSDAYRQIGNAVPPVLAWYVAKAVSDCLLVI